MDIKCIKCAAFRCMYGFLRGESDGQWQMGFWDVVSALRLPMGEAGKPIGDARRPQVGRGLQRFRYQPDYRKRVILHPSSDTTCFP
jgi:hypothetical protein